jgi:hypothetical protein
MKKVAALEQIVRRTWIKDGKTLFIYKYKELYTGLFCLWTDRMIYSIQVDEMEMFLESIDAFEALTTFRETKNKPAAKLKPKKPKLVKPLVFHENIEAGLQEVVRETSGTLYTLHNTGEEWKIYILRSKVLLKSRTLKEVLQLLLNEYLDKRIINDRYQIIKNQKPYTYGR